MKRAFKFRIYPYKNQEAVLNRTLSTCRHLYNNALEERRRQAELNRLCTNFQVFPWGKIEWIDYYSQSVCLTRAKTPEQKEVFSQVLQDVLRRLDKAFKNLYRGFGYPRFKGRDRYNSFTYPQNGFKLIKNNLYLSKIGNVPIQLHRKIEGKIKICSIIKDVDQWYAVFITDIEKHIEQVRIKLMVGVDVGLKSITTLSDGKHIEAPRFLRSLEDKLVHEQKRLSRKKRGSKNRNKQRIKVAIVHRKIRNQRKDFAHKTSRELVNNYDLIAFENLNIKGMVHNHHLAKSIMDAGWYQLQTFTAYKAEDAGKQVKFVIANRTSQECCVCGNVEHLTLADRVFRCSKCGNVKDRDHNAAINIKNRVHADCMELTPAESTQKGLVETGIFR